jgi:hypothetical protein
MINFPKNKLKSKSISNDYDFNTFNMSDRSKEIKFKLFDSNVNTINHLKKNNIILTENNDLDKSNQSFNLSSGNWTIEAWIYRNFSGANHCILNLVNSFSFNYGLAFYVNSSNQLAFDAGAGGGLAGGTVPSGQWVYVALVRSSGTTTGYVNGSSIGTTSLAPSTSQYARIGKLASVPDFYFNGSIQDLRITKGVARTITTPTAAFPTQ